MASKRVSTYQVLVYMAYGFYFLLGLSWLLVSFMGKGQFNPTAGFIMLIYGAQFYYRHLITNLILGVVSLFLSIFMLLQAMNSIIPQAQHRQLMLIDRVLLTLPVVSIVMAGILVFSYIKLNFKDQ